MTDTDETRETETESTRPNLFWCGLYLVTLAYGGPEEGGWWYQTGALVTDPEIYDTLGTPTAAFTTEKDADAHAAVMGLHLDKLNHGRLDISQTNSTGLFQIEVMQAPIIPAGFPDRKPVYD